MITLRLGKYSVWFFVNFIICLLPFFLMWVSDYSKIQIFSGFLAYNFTLLISSLYLFKSLIDIEKDQRTTYDIIFWITFGWLLFLYSLFILYPAIPKQEISLWIIDHTRTCILIIISMTLVVSLLLNIPSIEGRITELQQKRKYKESQETKESFKDKKTTLKQENNP